MSAVTDIMQYYFDSFGDPDRIFKTRLDLISTIGCKIVLVDKLEKFSDSLVGNSPEWSVSLAKNKEILIEESISNYKINCAIHEAIHFIVGEASFEDETLTMGLEFVLSNMIASKEERVSSLEVFSQSYDSSQNPICSQIVDYGFEYFDSDEWNQIFNAGVKQKFITNKLRLNTKFRSKLLK